MQPPIQDFSLPNLFLHADPVVKGVILLLVLASIAVWAIIIDRAIRFNRIRHDVRRLGSMSRDPSVAPVRGSLSETILNAGNSSAAARMEGESHMERQDRVRETMRFALLDALRAVEPGLPFLATVGSTAPFVGLFGTVWGIMNSFTGIAAANDTSLSVVAPGIAEALFSTAIGLAAAIPAVVAYNKLAAHLTGSRALGLSAIARLASRLSMTSGGALARAAG